MPIRVTAANAHNVTEIINWLNRPIVRRAKSVSNLQHLCADKAYDSEEVRTKLRKRNITLHTRKRNYGTSDAVLPLLESEKPPVRRWVVERTLFWQNDFRSLRTRWAKKPSN